MSVDLWTHFFSLFHFPFLIQVFLICSEKFFSTSSFSVFIFLLALIFEVICYSGFFCTCFCFILNNIFFNSLRISPSEVLYWFYLVSWNRQYIFYNLYFLDKISTWIILRVMCLFFLYRQLFLSLMFLLLSILVFIHNLGMDLKILVKLSEVSLGGKGRTCQECRGTLFLVNKGKSLIFQCCFLVLKSAHLSWPSSIRITATLLCPKWCSFLEKNTIAIVGTLVVEEGLHQLILLVSLY